MKHILIVDDSKTNYISAKNALMDMYQVSGVSGGLEALQFLESTIPDLILLDINMPQMDGFEVMQEIRKNEKCKEIPIIFLTADNDAETESKCLETGAMDFVAKPFVPLVIRSRISRILELEDLRKSLAERLDKKTKEVKEIKTKSLRDPLTGLWNRSYTKEKVEEFMREGKNGALFMMDMDNFKAINDRYGHIAGDHTLKLFADTLRKYAYEEDVLCRIGGDEFMTYVVGGESTKSVLGNHAGHIISEMLKNLEECQFDTNSSVSVGIAQFPGDGTDFDELYNAADKALYYVKQNGKNSYHFYSDQSAAQEKRASKSVDLNYLRDIMKRTDAGKGSYMLEFENFHHVYNFIRRLVERSDRNVQTLLFTLKTEEWEREDPLEIEKAVELLECAVFTSLRRVDVSTRYSSRQIVVILFDADAENGANVAERILANYKELYSGELEFEYDIVKLQGNPG